MAVTTLQGRIKMTAANDEVTGRRYANCLYWYSKSATAGDDLVVTDSSDATIWACVADGTNFTAVIPIKNWVDGVKIATIDSGTFWMYPAPARTEHQY